MTIIKCLDYSLKAMLPVLFNGSNILETNVVGDTSPLAIDLNAIYPQGGAGIFADAIFERTDHDLQKAPPLPSPGLKVGSWIQLPQGSVNYQSISYALFPTSVLNINNYVFRPLTTLEKVTNNFLYGRWRVKQNLATPPPALPDLGVSDSNYLWLEYSNDFYYKTPSWSEDVDLYPAGTILWVANNPAIPSIGFGFIATIDIAKDINNRFINEPKPITADLTYRPYWKKIDDDNPYRLFNFEPKSVTISPELIYYKLLITDDFKEIAFEGVDADEIEVIATDITETDEHFNETFPMLEKAGNEYDYFFNQNASKDQLLIESLPRRGSGILTIRIKKPGGFAKLASISIGIFNEIGHQPSVNVGANQVGGEFNHPVEIDQSKFDDVVKYLNDLKVASVEQKRPGYYKSTGFLESAWGPAFLQDFMLLHNNDGLEKATTNLVLKEVI